MKVHLVVQKISMLASFVDSVFCNSVDITVEILHSIVVPSIEILL